MRDRVYVYLVIPWSFNKWISRVWLIKGTSNFWYFEVNCSLMVQMHHVLLGIIIYLNEIHQEL